MKTVIILSFAILTLLGCNQNTEREVKNIPEKDTVGNDEKSIVKPSSINQDEVFRFEQLNKLIPIDTIDSKNKNIYEKYGLEFNGNCYACDLANLSVTENVFKLTNVCDDKRNQVYKIIKITNNKNEIVVKTEQNNFIFTKIDKAPIFELKIVGNEIKIENLRISRYYTLKELLKKFKQHDCGDFDG